MDVEHSRQQAVLQVILRIPAWFLMESMLLDNNFLSLLFDSNGYLAPCADILASITVVVCLLSSLSTLIKIYLRAVAFLLILMSAGLCRTYLTGGASNFSTRAALLWRDENEDLQRDVSVTLIGVHIVMQYTLNSLVGYLMNLYRIHKLMLMVNCVPIFLDIMGWMTPDVHRGCSLIVTFTYVLYLSYTAIMNLGSILPALKSDVVDSYFESIHNFGVLRTFVAYWHNHMVSSQLTLFWLVLYVCRVFKYFAIESDDATSSEEWATVAFVCIGTVCATQLSIIACCFTVSYLSKLVINVIKVFVLGDTVGAHDEVTSSGIAEGIMMFFISFQVDLLQLKPLDRAITLMVIICLVVTTLIQSIYELTEPRLLALSASVSRSNIGAHAKTLLLCAVLLFLPLTMCYYIFKVFDIGAVSLIIAASFAVTSIQVMGSLVVYALFLMDSFREVSWQGLDDAVYFTRAFTRIIDFFVAVFVVSFGLYETAMGDRNWINLLCLLLHLYFGIWLRLQEGWKSFLLRRNAVKKVEALDVATKEQLEEMDDICAICHQEMQSARITHCKHFFHDVCLRKWLYVQDRCPLCHQSVTPPEQVPADNPTPQNQNPNPGGAAAPPPPQERIPETLHEVNQRLDEAIQNLTQVIQQMEDAEGRRQQIMQMQHDSGAPSPPSPSMDLRTRTRLMDAANTLTKMAEEQDSQQISDNDGDSDNGGDQSSSKEARVNQQERDSEHDCGGDALQAQDSASVDGGSSQHSVNLEQSANTE